MDVNYWYYTLSTIPQTLAAMIALAATFVVFKLNILSDKIKDYRFDLKRFVLILNDGKEIHEIEPMTDKEFLQLYEKGLSNTVEMLKIPDKQKRFFKEMERIIFEWRSYFRPDNERVIGYLTMRKESFSTLLALKDKILSLLGWSTRVTALTIAISLTALPNYNHIPDPVLLVEFVMGFAVVSVILTAYSIWSIANESLPKEHK